MSAQRWCRKLMPTVWRHCHGLAWCPADAPSPVERMCSRGLRCVAGLRQLVVDDLAADKEFQSPTASMGLIWLHQWFCEGVSCDRGGSVKSGRGIYGPAGRLGLVPEQLAGFFSNHADQKGVRQVCISCRRHIHSCNYCTCRCNYCTCRCYSPQLVIILVYILDSLLS
jgi:hypothetical protein